MPRKKKYENVLIAKGILAREFQQLGDIQRSMKMRFLDIKDPDQVEFFKKNARDMMNIFADAIKELEGE